MMAKTAYKEGLLHQILNKNFRLVSEEDGT